MHDPRYLRDNLDAVRTTLGRRGEDVPWDTIQKLSDERRTLTTQVEQLRHELKKGSVDVARLRRLVAARCRKLELHCRQGVGDKGAALDELDRAGRTALSIADGPPIDRAVELLTTLITKSGQTPKIPSKR